MARRVCTQEQADIETALLLTSWWKCITIGHQEDRQTLQQEAERMQSMAGYKQVNILRKNLDQQILRMFLAIDAARTVEKTTKASRMHHGFEKINGGTGGSTQEREDWRPPNRRRRPQTSSTSRRGEREDMESARESARRGRVYKSLRQDLGYTLCHGPSSIPSAGRGVFLEGRARIGSLVGIYPGLVYLPEHLRKAEEVAELFPDPDIFLFQRYDKIVVDGRAAEKMPHNEYALAHLCNHGKPNVMAVAYDFPQDPLGWGGFPHELRPYIPNAFARPRSLLGSPDQSALIQSVVLVATTDLEDGEELFLNYRLNPKHGSESLPPWYVPVDAKEDQRRWA
ncbi:hypothetical protein NSK_001513 [Nannochloropsis salina CCMP1776]|uniref:SET domain-containing protein n=1 Tax=Nannochloropsis salina CCMP1776 TaxID=1027361 RepID=A0A4D9D642_9STRA|nr:hypothetical protein NSK_001513 [Nannochloropsis salina CCMP1776]|eukprot:TFJ87181.1 hypothetical protein NSK_001513 [Nannochloropsis salina CCMP1776]